MRVFDNEQSPYGSAAFIDHDDQSLKPYFKKTQDSLFIGFVGKRALYWNGMGGILLTAGARSGKLRDCLAYSILDGGYLGTLLILDQKGELAALSKNQTKSGKHCIYWNVAGLHGLPQHRINPVEYMDKGNPTLVSDVKAFAENMISITGSAQADFFERRGREFLEGICLTLIWLHGTLTLPLLYHTINLIPGNSEEWRAFAFEMHECGFPISKRIEEEIAASHENEGGGMRGILGEIFKSFTALSDPLLMESVSPPYDFSLADLCSSSQKYNLYLMPPAEFIESWSGVLKAMFVGAMIYKSRAPSAPRQTWILDECAQLASSGFPLVTKMFSYGAGIGIRPLAVFQATSQMKAIGKDAESIITSSAAVRIYFGIRDIGSASTLSKMLGNQTLEYDDTLAQSRDDLARKQALHAILNGDDPLEVGIKLAHHKRASVHRSKMQRALRTSDEILNTPENKAYAFVDGIPYPVEMDRKPYYEQAFLAGRFHPNPYHPPLNKVRVKTFWGYRWKNIITEPVPAKFAHLPQYANGTWSYVEGYR